jgi:isopenicillin N synthase-like dioxygenase
MRRLCHIVRSPSAQPLHIKGSRVPLTTLRDSDDMPRTHRPAAATGEFVHKRPTMANERDILSVPVIDIAALIACASDADVQQAADNAALQAMIADLRAAATEWGFFYISNHGMTNEDVETFRTNMRAFFELSKTVKETVKRTEHNSRGYFDDELTKNKTDWKEGLDFGGRLEDGPVDTAKHKRMGQDQNQWLSEGILPGFHDAMMDYFDRMEHISRRLLMLFALALGKDAVFLDQFYRTEKEAHSNSSFLRLNYYPVSPDPDSTMGVHHHTDAGGLTVLLQDDHVASLQVFHRETQEWYLIPPRPQTFVINIGDMLQIWSNDQFVAPLHRVLANGSRERYSAPFFYNPSYEATVAPVLASEAQTPQYRPLSWYDFRLQRFQGDYADHGEEVQIAHYRI